MCSAPKRRPTAPRSSGCIAATLYQRGTWFLSIPNPSPNTCTAPAFPIDEIVADVHRAVRYIRYHAKEYHIDPDRLAILGMSSGGYLAAHVGVCGGEGPSFPKPDYLGIGRYDPIEVEASSKVAAFVSVSGPSDFLNYGAERRSIL